LVKIQYFVGVDSISPGSAETNVGWCEKLCNDLMSSCLRIILTKNY